MTPGRLKALLRSDKGSSTVLIILILLSLTVFSVLSLASAMSDYTLSQKNASWLKAYYQTESKAERFLGAVSKELKSAETAALGAPAPADTPGRALYRERIYFLEAYRRLEKRLDGLPEDSRPSSFELYPDSDFEAPDFLSSGGTPSLHLTANIEGALRDKNGNETLQNIAVSLEIIYESGNMRVLGWREWQPEFDYGGGMDIWMGE